MWPPLGKIRGFGVGFPNCSKACKKQLASFGSLRQSLASSVVQARRASQSLSKAWRIYLPSVCGWGSRVFPTSCPRPTYTEPTRTKALKQILLEKPAFHDKFFLRAGCGRGLQVGDLVWLHKQDCGNNSSENLVCWRYYTGVIGCW